MDETLTTAGEPQVIESANTYEGDVQTAGLAQTIDTQVQSDGSQVIETATPMDNNVTYQNVAEDTTPSFDPNKDYGQNIIQNALQTNYQNTVAQTDGSAMTQFLDHDYDYNKSEAGTYWVAGAINDVDTQMSFLNTLVREEMYDELDLQKYYYDTTMATARAYASQKKKETAYGFYRAAQEKAIAEAQLTGWYMPAEGNYMLGQYTVAQNKLEDLESTPEEKARAQRISGTVEKWFNANQIGTRGIKCLNMMNYEENVRHNTIMGELQKEANKIAAGQAGASGALAAIQLREFKFQVEEMEMQYGFDFTKDIGLDNKDYIGHDVFNDPEYKGRWEFLQGAKDVKEILKNPEYYSAILTARNVQWLKDTLGEETYEDYNRAWRASTGDMAIQESLKNNGNILDDSYLSQDTNTIASKEKDNGGGKHPLIISSTNEDGTTATRAYYKDSNEVLHQITKDVELSNGKKISEVYKDFDTTPLEKNGQGINVGSKFNRQEFTTSISQNTSQYKNLNDDTKNKIKELEGQGWKEKKGYFSTKRQNTPIVMEDKDGNLIEVETDGTTNELTDKEEIRYFEIQNKPGTKLFEAHKDGDMMDMNDDNGQMYKQVAVEKDVNGKTYNQGSSHTIHEDYIVKKSFTVPGGTEDNEVLIWSNPDGENVYIRKEKLGYNRYQYSIISRDDATKYSKWSEEDFNTYQDNCNNYDNGYIKTTPGLNQDARIEQMKQKAEEREKNKSTKTSSGGSGGSSGPMKSGIETQNTVDDRKAEYQEYVLRMKDEPNAEILPYEEWVKNRPSINDVKAV